jgi:hypothetical protein
MVNFVEITAVKAILHLKGQGFCPYFLHLLITKHKIGTRDAYKNFLSNCEFHKNQHRQSYISYGIK